MIRSPACRLASILDHSSAIAEANPAQSRLRVGFRGQGEKVLILANYNGITLRRIVPDLNVGRVAKIQVDEVSAIYAPGCQEASQRSR